MEFDPRTDRLPFNEPDEAQPTPAGVTEPSHDARIRHLQRVQLFSGFSEKELSRIAELSRIFDVPAGSTVTQVGEPGDSFFVIIDGTVAVRTPVGTGAELHPGEFFGEMSLLDGEPRSATIVATRDANSTTKATSVTGGPPTMPRSMTNAASARLVPPSVIATKWLPASPPFSSRTRSLK